MPLQYSATPDVQVSASKLAGVFVQPVQLPSSPAPHPVRHSLSAHCAHESHPVELDPVANVPSAHEDLVPSLQEVPGPQLDCPVRLPAAPPSGVVYEPLLTAVGELEPLAQNTLAPPHSVSVGVTEPALQK